MAVIGVANLLQAMDYCGCKYFVVTPHNQPKTYLCRHMEGDGSTVVAKKKFSDWALTQDQLVQPSQLRIVMYTKGQPSFVKKAEEGSTEDTSNSSITIPDFFLFDPYNRFASAPGAFQQPQGMGQIGAPPPEDIKLLKDRLREEIMLEMELKELRKEIKELKEGGANGGKLGDGREILGMIKEVMPMLSMLRPGAKAPVQALAGAETATAPKSVDIVHNNTQQQQMKETEIEVNPAYDDALDILETADPNWETNMIKLAALAKNDPNTFSFVIGQFDKLT